MKKASAALLLGSILTLPAIASPIPILQLEILAHFLVGNGGFDLVLPSPSGPVPDELRRWCNGWQEAGAQAAEFRDGEGLREPCDYAAAVWSSGPVSFRLQNAARR